MNNVNQKHYSIIVLCILIFTITLSCDSKSKIKVPLYDLVQSEDMSIGIASRLSVVAMTPDSYSREELYSIVNEIVNRNKNTYDIIWIHILPKYKHVDNMYESLVYALYVHPSVSEWTPMFNRIEEKRDNTLIQWSPAYYYFER